VQNRPAAWWSRWLPPGLVALGVGAICFFHLGRYGLWEADEPRYAEIAREMVVSGHYLIPRLDYVAYVEKPPLLYWLTSLSFALFGPTQFAARLVPALAALGGVMLTFWFTARSLGRRRATLAAALLGTAPLYAVLAQVLLTDMLLTLLLTCAFFTFFVVWREGGRLWPMFYLAIALAVLTKGPIGLLLPAVVGLLFLWGVEGKPRQATVRNFHPLAGGTIVAIIALPWFLLMSWRLPGYADFYFVGEHLRRFFVASYSHGEPFYFYLPVLLGGLMPWALCLPLLWRYGTRGPVRSYCALAAGVVLGVFSLANAKLIPYILPALPPLAVLLADSIVSAIEAVAQVRAGSEHRRTATEWILSAPAAVLVLGGSGLLIFALTARHGANPYLALLRPSLITLAAVISAGGCAAFAFAWRRHFGVAVAVVALTSAAGLLTGTYCRIAAEPIRPYSALCRAVAAQASRGPIICYHRYVQGLPFYTRRRVLMVGNALSELRFGAEHCPRRARYFLPDDEALLALWRREPRAILVIDAPELSRLQPRLGPIRILAREGSKRAVIRAPKEPS
jgi:4-amino-4-deoxy-L-arabinose transferase-like glycosyltransferase